MRFQLPSLPFSMDALEPYISAETLEFHYRHHHKAYVDETNHLLEAPTAWQDELKLEEIVQTSSGSLFNNAAQSWNHTFFWHCLTQKGKGQPTGELAQALKRDFGSFEGFKKQFIDEALGVFGSGWIWLVKETTTDRLSIVSTSNADTPIVGDAIPLVALDVWEHAYYIDYRNARSEFIQAFWNITNWDFAADNFLLETVPDMTRLMIGAAANQASHQSPQPQHP